MLIKEFCFLGFDNKANAIIGGLAEIGVTQLKGATFKELFTFLVVTNTGRDGCNTLIVSLIPF